MRNIMCKNTWAGGAEAEGQRTSPGSGLEPETRIIARIMATGFNRHITEHGPDGDHAGEVAEAGDGHGLVVTRGGVQYGVRVERLETP